MLNNLSLHFYNRDIINYNKIISYNRYLMHVRFFSIISDVVNNKRLTYNKNKNSKRYMMSSGGGPNKWKDLLKASTWGNKLLRFDAERKPWNNLPVRHSPGRYRTTEYEIDATKEDGSPLDQHEKVHYSIYDTETGELIGLLTSAKKGFKLDSIKMDGSYIEFTDSEGNIVAHPEKGGQYFMFYGAIRVVNKNVIKKYKPGSVYLEKHEKTITDLREKENIDGRPRSMRVLQAPTKPKETNNLNIETNTEINKQDDE